MGQFPRQPIRRAAGAAWAARRATPTCWTATPAARARARAWRSAASLCALAIGTETNGSIVCPATNNGIVGLKPTVGLVSRAGIIPISFTQDTAGPMGRTVEDVALCLGALTGVDEADAKTLAAAGHALGDYAPFLKADGLKGKRIGLLKNLAGYHHRVDALLEQAAAYLKSRGAEVVELEGPKEGPIENDSFQVMLYEFKDGLNRYFAGLDAAAPVRDLAGLIEFNKKDPVELRWFDQKLLEQAQEKGGLEAAEYRKALAAMLKAARTEGIDKLMDDHKLDALMAPTGAPAWKTDLVDGDHFTGSSSSLAAIAGYPSITVPMGASTSCRSASPSSAAPGASRSCSRSPTPTSRGPGTAGRRSTSRRTESKNGSGAGRSRVRSFLNGASRLFVQSQKTSERVTLLARFGSLMPLSASNSKAMRNSKYSGQL